MQISDYIRLGEVAIETSIFVCAPILLIGLVAGLAVSIFQAATQISDPSLAFIPKIGALVVGLLVCGNFMLNRLMAFTVWVFTQIPNYAN